ncbi:MAG: S8 family serine peptidase, partial [Candidatus Thalassarchaeaceae archaeon]|nr:S8 family serine peptidase [Candidatus Thalassarchaeaceae archaeon]
ISAPGSNIIQAEGCVTSGGCSNLFNDASDNSYTGRGSGTSYATPSVSGVMALVWEANENLTTMQLKEILKQTAERRGEASLPEIDPYWNRDFGFGMVDAYAATLMAIHIKESGTTELIDPGIQNHLISFNDTDNVKLVGHSWSTSGSVESVNFRIDGGEWIMANFNSSIIEVGPITPFEWYIEIDPNKFSKGTHELEVVAFSSSQQSLPVIVQFESEGETSSSYDISSMTYILVAIIVIIWLSIYFSIRLGYIAKFSDSLFFLGSENDGTMDAEIIE